MKSTQMINIKFKQWRTCSYIFKFVLIAVLMVNCTNKSSEKVESKDNRKQINIDAPCLNYIERTESGVLLKGENLDKNLAALEVKYKITLTSADDNLSMWFSGDVSTFNDSTWAIDLMNVDTIFVRFNIVRVTDSLGLVFENVEKIFTTKSVTSEHDKKQCLELLNSEFFKDVSASITIYTEVHHMFFSSDKNGATHRLFWRSVLRENGPDHPCPNRFPNGLYYYQ